MKMAVNKISRHGDFVEDSEVGVGEVSVSRGLALLSYWGQYLEGVRKSSGLIGISRRA